MDDYVITIKRGCGTEIALDKDLCFPDDTKARTPFLQRDVKV